MADRQTDPAQVTYPCVVGNQIRELTARQRDTLEWCALSDGEKIARLLERIETLERALGINL